MKNFRFYEYSGFEIKGGNVSDDISEMQLSDVETKYLHNISENTIPNKNIFDFTKTKIKATSLVGIIAFDGIQIEILPKLIRNSSSNEDTKNSSILTNLMYMLSYTNELEISDISVGSMPHNSASFIEAYITIFSNRLAKHLIQYGLPKSYVEKSENLHTIKGKISFVKNSSRNCFDQSRIYCDYSDFTENNGLSKAFKFVSQSLLHITSNSSSIVTLSRCIGLLDGVKAEFVNEQEIDRLSIGKREQNLVALINLTKMFLRKMRPEFVGQKKNNVFTLLFDMNELFEEFIFKILKRNESELKIRVQAQKHRRLVSAERDFLKRAEWQTRSLFATYTDISVTPFKGKSFIIDTKYKIVNSDKSHYGISNQDAYQVLAYRQIHKIADEEPSVALLYPKEREEIQKEFRVNGSNTTFFVWTIDISIDLKNSVPILVHNLKNLIDKATTYE